MAILSSSTASSNDTQFGLTIQTGGGNSSLMVRDNVSVVQSVEAFTPLETISTFADQEERTTNNTVFARKTSGDQRNEINNSKSGINFKNEKVKRVVTLSESYQTNEYVSSNLTRDINASKESSHYFDGFKKFVDLKLAFFSGVYLDNPWSTIDSGVLDDLAYSTFNNTLYAAGRFSGLLARPLGGTFANIPLPDGPNLYIACVAISPVNGAVYAGRLHRSW